MLIQSSLVLATLTKKVQSYGKDFSRHLLCPSCRIRTKLYTLKDGRKKCSICVLKFDTNKKTDIVKVQQYADILLCFCFDFSAQQTSKMTKYHYRLVATIYRHFRILLAEQNLTPCKMQLLSTVEKHDRFSDSAFLRRGKEVFHLGGIKAGDAPVFGVKFVKGGRVFIEPLADDEALFLFDQISIDESPISKGRFSAYAGFIRQGKFQRFTDNEKLWDGAEQLWTWISERIRNHHGIWKRNIGLYFKELEWKYNNRLLTPETQALKIAKIIPADFLVQWSLKAKKK